MGGISKPATPTRVYDKGERRFKHVGKGDQPYIEFDPGQPRRWIGKCPTSHTDADRAKLLGEAIEAPNDSSELDFAKTLYVVDDGAIYEAQSSDWGVSYHGYPYRGRMGHKLLEELRAMAKKKQCLGQFETWVKEHIELHGQ
jgi:hypothetical protein